MAIKEKDKHFIDMYLEIGNQAEAYRISHKSAAQKTAVVAATKLIRKPEVRAYLDERLAELKDERTAGIMEVQTFWTKVMRNTDEDMKNRLRASEFIARTHGAFLDKVEHSGGVDLNIKIDWV